MEYNRLAALGLLNAVLWWQLGFGWVFLGLLSLGLVLAHSRDSLDVIRRTWRRDLSGFKFFFQVQADIRGRVKANRPLHEIFTAEVVARHPRKPALLSVSEGPADPSRQLTFEELDWRANQVANVFTPGKAPGTLELAEGDCVAVFMSNSPEYIATWLGLSKVGVVSALINFNQRLEPLGHSVRAAKCKAIILDKDFESAVSEAIAGGHIPADIPVFVHGDSPSISGALNLDSLLKAASKLQPSYKAATNFKSVLFYIFTSGTTGLPKPAIITNARFYFMARGVHKSFRISGDDRLYITMPLYHSAAGILGAGQVLLSGSSAVIKRKFSASKFWTDAMQYEATVSQYIGEIARYLLAQPFREEETKHKIHMMFGNGMRPGIWKEFVERFGIARIGEFYGSTEGNSSILNIDNTIGKVGFFPVFGAALLAKIYPVSLIKVDEDTGEVVRGRDGLCQRAGPGESGEMVGKVVKGDPLKDFSGYADAKETEKKLIRNVFKHGDVFFASGDILAQDRLGYLTFKDRTGDTFRWKGENVSTAEVELVVQKALGLGDATVYGVAIPGQEGKAGMAGLVDENANLDLAELQAKLSASLPPYARPVFIRVLRNVDTTGTYKLRKTDVQKDGFDLSKVKNDAVYYLSVKSGVYERLTPEIYDDIMAEKVKF